MQLILYVMNIYQQYIKIIIFFNIKMRLSKPRKSYQEGISPWQAKQEEDDDSYMAQFCHNALPKIKPQKNIGQRINQQYNQHHLQSVCPQTNKSKRPISNINSTRQIVQRKSIFDRLSANSQRQPVKSAQKVVQPPQIKFQAFPLQEITVKNYVIEGSREYNNNKQTIGKKRQSSYIMKQKFAEIRRSMNLQLGIWGGLNKGNSRDVKYESKDKQNMILKHLRYELN